MQVNSLVCVFENVAFRRPQNILKFRRLFSDEKYLFEIYICRKTNKSSRSGWEKSSGLFIARFATTMRVWNSLSLTPSYLYFHLEEVIHINSRMKGFVWRMPSTDGTYNSCYIQKVFFLGTENFWEFSSVCKGSESMRIFCGSALPWNILRFSIALKT